MSEIIINEKNFAKFSKRLQKLLHSHKKQLTQLSYLETQELFSQVLGKSDLHEMKLLLKEKSPNLSFSIQPKLLLSSTLENTLINALMIEALEGIKNKPEHAMLKNVHYVLFDNPILTKLNQNIIYFKNPKLILLNKMSLANVLNQESQNTKAGLVKITEKFIFNNIEKIENKQILENTEKEFFQNLGLPEIAIELGFTLNPINKKEKNMDNNQTTIQNEQNHVQLKQTLVHNYLVSLYKNATTNKDEIQLNEKIKKTYESWYKKDISQATILPILSVGDIEDKELNDNYKKSAQEVAKTLGLNFVQQVPTLPENPTNFQKRAYEAVKALDLRFVDYAYDNKVLTKQDLLYINLNSEELEKNTTLLEKIKNSAGAIMVVGQFDAPNETNKVISILENKKFNGIDLSNATFGLVKNSDAQPIPKLFKHLVKEVSVNPHYQLTEDEKQIYNQIEDNIINDKLEKNKLGVKITQLREGSNVFIVGSDEPKKGFTK
jgi:hypothetical protein